MHNVSLATDKYIFNSLKNMSFFEKLTYPVIYHIEPSLSTEDVAGSKLDHIKWEIKNDTVKPDDTSPTPADSLDPCKPPVGINSDQSCHLKIGTRLDYFPRSSSPANHIQVIADIHDQEKIDYQLCSQESRH